MSTIDQSRKKVVIVGGGPTGMMAATQLLNCNCEIVIVDQKASIGRKFLVAGDGGFNLTHSEPLTTFCEKYDKTWIKNVVSQFTNTDFVSFLHQIGVSTVVGSSGKVFPVDELKPIQVLNAWKKHLDKRVSYKLGCRLIDFSTNCVSFQVDGEVFSLEFDFLILCLGGKSWSITGSDGAWTELLAKKNVPIVPFTASNSGLVLYENWRVETEGKIIKNVVVSCNGFQCAGDLVCTAYGLEGKPIYAVNRGVRACETPYIEIDFKPQMELAKIIQILKTAKNPSHGLKMLKLPEVAVFWLKTFVSKKAFTDPKLLAHQIKNFRIGIKGFRPIDEVISTAGGVAIESIDEFGELKNQPNVFCSGEMLDWDAPTGGYLIQGCVSSGFIVGKRVADLLVNPR